MSQNQWKLSMPKAAYKHIPGINYSPPVLLPVETAVCDKQTPDETVSMILLPAENLGRKQNHVDSLSRKPFFMHRSLCGEARDRGPSRQKPNISYSFSKTWEVYKWIISTQAAMTHIYSATRWINPLSKMTTNK